MTIRLSLACCVPLVKSSVKYQIYILNLIRRKIIKHTLKINILENIFNPMVSMGRSSHQRCFVKKGVLRNFAKFTGKHLCHRLIFNDVAGLRHATSLKKILWHRYFPVNFVKSLRAPFLYIEHLQMTDSA